MIFSAPMQSINEHFAFCQNLVKVQKIHSIPLWACSHTFIQQWSATSLSPFPVSKVLKINSMQYFFSFFFFFSNWLGIWFVPRVWLLPLGQVEMRFLSCIKLIWIVTKYKTRKSIPRPHILRGECRISREKLISAALSNFTALGGISGGTPRMLRPGAGITALWGRVAWSHCMRNGNKASVKSMENLRKVEAQ